MKVMLDDPSPDDVLRFVSEAKITGQLEHPNIVPVHELGVDEKAQVFYTMKYRARDHAARRCSISSRTGRTRHDRKISARPAAHRFPKGLRRHRLCPLQGRHPSRPQARERDDRRLRRGARHGLGPRESARSHAGQGRGRTTDARSSAPACAKNWPPPKPKPSNVMGTPQYMAPEQAWGATRHARHPHRCLCARRDPLPPPHAAPVRSMATIRRRC